MPFPRTLEQTPEFLEVTMKTMATILTLSAMNPNGGTSHTITGRTDAGDEVTLWSVSGYTVNGQWLESSDINPTAVRYVRVTTTTTPSWVAWAEIEIYAGSAVAVEEIPLAGIKSLFR